MEKAIFLCVLVGLTWANETFELTTKPGARMWVTKSGIEMAKSIAAEAMKKEMKKMKMMWTYEPEDGCTFELMENPKMEKYEHPEFHVEMSPPTTMIWKTSGGHVNISGEWKLTKENTWTGKYWSCFDKMELDMPLMLDMSSEGKPTVEPMDCHFHLHNSHLHFEWNGEPAHDMDDLMKTYFKKSFEAMFMERVCEHSKRLITTRAATLLEMWPVRVPLSEHLPVMADFSLVEPPVVTDNWVTAGIRGGIFWQGTEGTPFEPAPLPSLPEHMEMKMMVMQASDYLMNSYMWSMFNHNKTQFYITPEKMGKFGVMMKTSCEEICVGKLSEELTKEYPDTFIHLFMRAKRAIKFHIEETGMKFEGVGEIHAYIPANAERGWAKNISLVKGELLFNGEMVNITCLKESNKIHGEVKFNKMDLMLKESTLTDVTQETMGKLAELALKKDKSRMQAMLDRFTGKGIPIPMLPGMKITGEPHLMFQKGAAILNTDIEYTPPHTEE